MEIEMLGVVVAATVPALAQQPIRESREVSCFPVSRSVQVFLERGRRLGGAAFVEENTRCGAGGGDPVVEVPDGLSGFEALSWIVEGHAQRGGARYEVVPDAGGWVISEAGADRVLDAVVDVDPVRCPTVATAERCVFSALYDARRVWVGHPMQSDLRSRLPNAVQIRQRSALAALRSIYAPHQRDPTGFTLLLEPEPLPGDPTRRVARYALLFDEPAAPDRSELVGSDPHCDEGTDCAPR